jgi:hypothetical protein
VAALEEVAPGSLLKSGQGDPGANLHADRRDPANPAAPKPWLELQKRDGCLRPSLPSQWASLVDGESPTRILALNPCMSDL